MRLPHISALCCLFFIFGHTIFGAHNKQQAVRKSSVSQLVERSAGKTSCRGVIIRLGATRLKSKVNDQEIEIQEAKHGMDLKNIMTWRVDDEGKRLIIKFKPGMGDFGGGNRVTIRISRKAFAEPSSSLNDWYEWSLSTDII